MTPLEVSPAAAWVRVVLLICALANLRLGPTRSAITFWVDRFSPVVVPFHAFFGVTVMQTGYPLSSTFAASTKALGIDPIADQATGGGIAWGFGETPILIVTLVVFAQWVRSDARAARRFDRQAARDGDAALADYNARLQRLHDRQSTSA